MKDTKTRDYYKGNGLISILQTHFGSKMNLARIKFIALFLCALCKTQTVNYEKIASVFAPRVDRGSSLRRIQRFMAGYNLCSTMIAKLIVALLPSNPPFTLSMDRTNWKFGEANINILVLAICYKGMAFPVLHTMLDKRGNSNTAERIAIIDRFIEIFGANSIKHLTADREFVGDKWINYLNSKCIHYYLRIRNNFNVTRHGRTIRASHLFNSVKIGEFRPLSQVYIVGKEHCYLAASKIKNSDGVVELQIIVSFSQPELSKKVYKERWEIETAFKSLKTSGFNIEDTHLRDPERISKLFSLVLIAFTWAYLTGIYVDKHIKPIRVLKHKYKAKNLVKAELETIISTLNFGRNTKHPIDIFKFLSCS